MRLPTPSRSSILLLSMIWMLAACAPGGRSVPHAPPPDVGPLVIDEPEELGEDPEIIEEEVRVTGRDLLGGVAYDLPLEANSWVEGELDFLVGQRAAVIGRWLERGDYYEAFIKSVLAAEGLPTDLYHLAMIESGFIPSARSRVGATGLWQFMPTTGRLEGLRVDREVDERLDPVRSTYAAARHLRMLHRSFAGDWALAAAAYNAGSGRISRGLQGYEADNFWDLAVWGDLAEETKHYVPRLYAMTIIGRDRARFGFSPPATDRATFAYDSVQVDVPTPLSELAAVSSVGVDELARLNPHLLQRVTPSGKYWVWVPAGSGREVQQAFLDSEFRRNGGYGVYVVRRGDTLGKLAQTAGVPSARIRELNPRVDWNRLQIGARLRMPAAAARSLASRSPAEPTRTAGAATTASRAAANTGSSAPSARTTQHTVRSGESLWSIARRYGVSVDAIKRANRLRSETIVAGRKLEIPAVAGSGGLATAERNGAEPARHTVRAGDTLWSIAREYGSTVGAIQGANQIGDSTIQPGQQLLIPR